MTIPSKYKGTERAAYVNGYAWGKTYGQSGPPQERYVAHADAWAEGYAEGEWYRSCNDSGACP
jgi:hypothetical protein